MRTRGPLVRMIGALACALCLTLPAARATTPDWNALDADSHTLLAPWQDGWNGLPDSQRERLLANARRWQAMDANARADLLKRETQWQALPPSERARLRERYAAWKALPTDEQLRVRNAAYRFFAMPAPQQGALRAGFAAQETNQQADWLLGPSLGGWIEQAQALFAFVPAGDRDATLKMLQSLTTDTRNQLFTLARRLPTDQRELLRKQLVAADPSQRAALVTQRMAQ